MDRPGKDIVANAFEFLDRDNSGDFEVNEFVAMIFKLLNPPQA